ncbi:MAG TPA: hypothetical protein VF077_02955, partial [Nitrospiraceae bacterium]
PSVGDTVSIASLGTWNGSPTGYVTAIILRDGGGVETIVKTGTGIISYVVQSVDSAKTIIADVVATNAFGASTHARSAATAPIHSNPTAPAPPVIVPGSKPPNPTTQQSNDFQWTDTDAVDHYRWRLVTDGNVGPWNTTTALDMLVTTPAGHTYSFEVQAGNALNNYSSSDQYQWTVTASDVPSAPTFVRTPDASSAAHNVAFIWNNPESVTGYKWQWKLVRPTDPTPAFTQGQTYPVHDVLAPMEIGSYVFHVRAVNAAGTIGPESTFSFAITATAGGDPNAPTFQTVPGELDIDDNTDFTWN